MAPLPPIDAHSLLILLLQAGLLLSLALVLGRIAARFGLPAVAGELCAGVVIGPSILAHLAPAFYQWLLPHDPAQGPPRDPGGALGVVLVVGVNRV
jgi:Kef-type K+ transport system membrane component KefB